MREIIIKLFFTIDNMQNVIQNPDSFSRKENSLFYDKGYGIEIKALIRIVVEMVEEQQEIKSIHFKKNKKAT